jgi:hypothetical protein
MARIQFVSHAHMDGRDEPRVVAADEIAPKAAPDVHLEPARLGPLEVDVPAGAVERSLRAAHFLDLVEGIVPLAESLEGDLVRARQHLSHHVLEIQDRTALVTVEQWQERLERRQNCGTDPQRPFRGLVNDHVLVGLGELPSPGPERGAQFPLAFGSNQMEVLVNAVQEVARHDPAHNPARLGSQDFLPDAHELTPMIICLICAASVSSHHRCT